MKLKNLALALMVGAFALLSSSAGTAFASDDKDEDADILKCVQELEQKCELSQYGQTNCKQKAKQECKVKIAKKVVVVDEGKVLGKTHVPADTALDLKTTLAALMALGVGSAALIVKRKIA